MNFSNIQGLVSPTGLPAPNNGFDVLHLAECGLRNRIMLKRRCRVSNDKPVGVESKAAEIRRLEERMRTDEEDSEVLRVAHARVDELTAQRALLAAGTLRAKADRDTMADRICELGLLQ